MCLYNTYRRHALCFLTVLPVSILLSCVLFLFLWFFCAPLYSPAEYWIRDLEVAREIWAKRIVGSKIVVIAGSSGLFGVSSGLLCEKTGWPVLNLSTHAGLRINHHFELMKRYASPGDIVIFPLEYSAYSDDGRLTPWQVRQFSTWGRGYADSQSFQLQLILLGRVFPEYLLRIGDIHRKLPVRSDTEIALLSSGGRGYFSDSKLIYTVEGLNCNGDFLCDAPPSEAVIDQYEKGIDYFSGMEISQFVADKLRELSEFAKKNSIKVFLAHQPTIKNTFFDLSTEKHKEILRNYVSKIEGSGVYFIGKGECYNLDVRYFLDTRHHLNAEGAILRTLYLADEINNVLGKGDILDGDLNAYVHGKEALAHGIIESLRVSGSVPCVGK